MSVAYVPVQWNRFKYVYDAALLLAVGLYIAVFLWLAPQYWDAERPIDVQIQRMRAFGTAAFLMLTVILAIGPLARLDRRFLPLLYNRRHFGVMTCVVAFAHAAFVFDWYLAYSPVPAFEALLIDNVSYNSLLGFPFEAFGILALAILLALAATSHDFWLSFFGAPLWKSLHLAIYPAYAAVVAHVGFGYLQAAKNPLFAMVVAASAMTVVGLHLAAARRDRGAAAAAAADGWVAVCRVDEIAEGRGRTVRLAGRESAAVFRYDGKLSAISNACAHQNGPLGEGRIVFGCVTCPWHGFQYDPATGRAPAPFTERVPTYRLRLNGDRIELDPRANPPGTPVEPVRIAEDSA